MRRLLLVLFMIVCFAGLGMATSCIVRTHPDRHHRSSHVKRGHHKKHGKQAKHRKHKKHGKHRNH